MSQVLYFADDSILRVKVCPKGIGIVYYNIADLVGLWKDLNQIQYYKCFYVQLKERILCQIWIKIANTPFWGSMLRLFQYYIGRIFLIYK